MAGGDAKLLGLELRAQRPIAEAQQGGLRGLKLGRWRALVIGGEAALASARLGRPRLQRRDQPVDPLARLGRNLDPRWESLMVRRSS